jgi:predicted porin
MQKKIIALAVAGLVSGAAFAQSNVEIYGTLDIGYLNGTRDQKDSFGGVILNKNSARATSTGFEAGALSSNLIGFRGSEDLGNGLKATFQLELGLNESPFATNNGNSSFNRLGNDSGTEVGDAGAFAIRKQNIGLAGGFGSITFGRQSVLIDDAWAVGSAGMKNNAVGDLYSQATASGGSVSRGALSLLNVDGVNSFHDIRANELITYTSPNFSGFTGSVQYGKGQTDVNGRVGLVNADSNAEHTNWGLRANYDNGPLSAVFAYNNEKNDASTTAALKTGTEFDRDSWLLGANYNFGIVKVFGQYFDGERTDDTNAAGVRTFRLSSDVTGWELGVHVPVTAQITLAGKYFDTSYHLKDTTGAVVTKGSADGSGYQLAALYSLSKRTTAYAAYGVEEMDSKWRDTYKQSNEGRDFAVGIKHAF